MVWVDSAVNRKKNETGVSEVLGAILLMGVVAAAIGILTVAVLSQPPPQKIPSVNVEVTAIDNIVYIRHDGGDTLNKGEFNITLDGVDETSLISLLNGPASWSTWTTGQTLYYVVPSGQNVPASVQIISHFGSYSESIGIYTPVVITAPYAVRMIAGYGGAPYTDTTGNVWVAEQAYSPGGWGYIGGNTYSTISPISGTADPELYQTERYGNFAYNFTVPDGNYVVTLKFAEIYWTSSNQRVFNVTIQGTTVMSYVDLYALAGAKTAYDQTFPVTVNDGVLNIAFQSIIDNAKISSIQIVNA